MNFSNILQADVSDILFANRNKEYGAYELRKTYNKRLIIALAVMISSCMILSLVSTLTRSHRLQPSIKVSEEIILKKVNDPVSPVLPPPPPVTTPVKQIQIATIKVTTPVIVMDNLVTDPPVEQAAMEGIKIDVADHTGIMNEVTAPPVEKFGTGAVKSIVKENNYDKEVHFVQQAAQFPGGIEAWKKFLERNLRQDMPVDNGAPAGSYSVIVSFLVDKEGNVSEVKAENNPGYGTAAEAVRVIQRGPKWQPAVQNGHSVIYRQKQSVTFIVTEQ